MILIPGWFVRIEPQGNTQFTYLLLLQYLGINMTPEQNAPICSILFFYLISIALYVSEDEQFAYTKNGKLKAHWIGDTGYNANGKPIAKRKVLDEIPSD